MSLRRAPILLSLITVVLLTSCSQFESKLARAQRLERQGHPASALQIYEQLLARTPEADTHQRSELLVRMGECQYRLNRLAEAFAAFEWAAAVEASNATAHLRLGELLLAAGSVDRAREQAESVLKRAASNPDALALLGAAWAAAGNTGMAAQAYSRVLQVDPGRTSAAVALADVYNRDDKIAEAAKVLRDASQARPRSALPLLALGRLAEQEGDSQAAEDSYRKAVAAEDAPETNLRLAEFLQRGSRIAEAEQALRRVDAQRRWLPVALGDFRLASGHADSALEQYRLGLGRNASAITDSQAGERASAANGPSLAQQQRAAIVARLIEAEVAGALRQSGQPAKPALEQARRHLAQHGQAFDAATAELLRAEIALAEYDISAANQHAQQALAAAPDSPAAHYLMGVVHLRTGNPGEARREWAAAIDADAHFTPARLAIAEDALNSGDPQSADLQAGAAVRDEPGNLDALITFAKALAAEKRYSAAVIMAHRTLALDPAAVEPLLLFGNIALQQDRLADALIHFEKAVSLDPTSDEAIHGLLRVYRKGPLDRVRLRQMERLAGQPPVSAALMEITGRLYAERGWYADAKRCLSRTLQLDPRRAAAATALAELQFRGGKISPAGQSAAAAGGGSPELVAAFRSEQQNDLQQAASAYERALRAGDQTGVAANNLAWMYAQQAIHLDRALVLANSACKQAPNNPAVLDTMGFVYLQRREYTEAVKVLETASRLAAGARGSSSQDEVARQIRHHLAAAYLRAGQTEAAMQLAQSRSLWKSAR